MLTVNLGCGFYFVSNIFFLSPNRFQPFSSLGSLILPRGGKFDIDASMSSCSFFFSEQTAV